MDAGKPGATATGGKLTCSVSSIQLTAKPDGFAYHWTGPNGLDVTAQNPTVSDSGTYYLTVTNNTTGCSSSTSAKVTKDTNAPGATATGGKLTCSVTSIQLTAKPDGFAYHWTGPNGFNVSTQNPSVTDSGTYNLTVTNNATGCSSSTSATVTKDAGAPGATATGGKVTCTTPTVQLTAKPDGFSYSWTGPNGFKSSTQNPVVSDSGTYNLTVTNSATGCSSSTSTLVNRDAAKPGAVATGGKLTCSTSSVQLTAKPDGFGYSWTGPGGYASSDQNPTVSAPGTYNLTVTNSANGCSSTTSASVTVDSTKPNCTISGANTVACGSTNNQFCVASGSTLSYNWSISGNGSIPSGSTSGSCVTVVADTGGGSFTLSVTVSNSANGCSNTCQKTVQVFCQTGHMFPTQTTCSMYASGVAQSLTNVCYQIGGGNKVSNATPGVFFYYTKVVAPSPNFCLEVVQSKDSSQLVLFHLQQARQLNLYNDTCSTLGSGSETAYSSTEEVSTICVTGAIPGKTYIISAKYNTKTIVGSTAGGTVTYTFFTRLQGGNILDNTGAALKAIPGCSGATTALNPQVAADAKSVPQPVPDRFALHVNYPNPFNPTTIIGYDLPEASSVRISVFNMLGQEITTLVNSEKGAGYQSVEWNSLSNGGETLPSGVYVYRIYARSLSSGKEFRDVKKMILMK